VVRCVIIGGGGHARVLIDALQVSGLGVPVAVLDAQSALWGTTVCGVPIIGGDTRLPQLIREGVTAFIVGVGGIGDNGPRRRLFERGCRSGLTPLTVQHPSAACSSLAAIGEGSVVLPLAVVNAGARVGRNVIVNSGAIVEHDCAVADHVHVATGATLCSRVRVETMAHLGAGAIVRQGLTIGEGAVVGAGAVVVSDVAPWTVVVGVPTRVIGHRTPAPSLSLAEREAVT